MKKEENKFEGFDPEIQSWNFPMAINGWVHKLSGSEFKVLWYILRHTYGWQKNSDFISYNQFKYGIKRKDGKWADKGTGLSFPSIKKAIDGLIEKGFIEAEKKRNKEGRQGITQYRPRLKKIESGNPRLKKAESIKLNQETLVTIVNSQQSLNNNKEVSDPGGPLAKILLKKFRLRETEKEIEYFIGLIKKHSGLDLESEAELMLAWLRDHGIKRFRPRHRFANWLKKAEEFRSRSAANSEDPVRNKEKPYFWGNPMRQAHGKWWVIIDGEWKEFAGSEKEIEWK